MRPASKTSSAPRSAFERYRADALLRKASDEACGIWSPPLVQDGIGGSPKSASTWSVRRLLWQYVDSAWLELVSTRLQLNSPGAPAYALARSQYQQCLVDHFSCPRDPRPIAQRNWGDLRSAPQTPEVQRDSNGFHHPRSSRHSSQFSTKPLFLTSPSRPEVSTSLGDEGSQVESYLPTGAQVKVRGERSAPAAACWA